MGTLEELSEHFSDRDAVVDLDSDAPIDADYDRYMRGFAFVVVLGRVQPLATCRRDAQSAVNTLDE